jgi:hypothetical protein
MVLVLFMLLLGILLWAHGMRIWLYFFVLGFWPPLTIRSNLERRLV